MIGPYDWLNIAVVTGVSLAFVYVALRAIEVKGALAVPSYRRQALGVVLLSILLALNLAGSTVSGYLVYGNAGGAIGNGAFGIFFILLLALFYFVDSSVIVSRRTDPLSRDTLRWSKLRFVLWVAVIPAAVLVIPVDILSAGIATGPPPAWTIYILVPGIFVPPIAGAIFLPLASRRAGDPAFKRHMKWFGAAALLFFLGLFFGNNPNVAVGLFLTYVFDLGIAYALYRSVFSLVPVGTSTPSEVQTWSQSNQL
jgi:hypothetical protein